MGIELIDQEKNWLSLILVEASSEFLKHWIFMLTTEGSVVPLATYCATISFKYYNISNSMH